MITSSSNPKIKQVVALQTKGKERKATGYYVVEGIRMISEISQDDIIGILLTERSLGNEDSLSTIGMEQLKKLPYDYVSESIMKEISETKTPQGILAIVKQKRYRLEDYINQPNPLFIILETLQDPGNLGAIVRTAEGAGATAVIMNRTCVDIYNPKTIRATMGSLLRMPFLYVDELEETINQMKQKGISVYAAHLQGKNTYDRFDYTKGTGFLIGNEGNGLSNEIAACASNYLKIPMEGQLESLNAAISTGILAYEANRQRRQML